jgi:hypothetical protein
MTHHGYAVVLNYSTSHAMRVEKLRLNEGIPYYRKPL